MKYSTKIQEKAQELVYAISCGIKQTPRKI